MEIMKILFFVIASFILLNQATAQEIFISSLFSHSSYNKFQNNFGYEIGYNQFTKTNNRLGFTFSHSFNNTDYNYIFMSDADGIDYYRDVDPNNQKITLSINYSFNILNKQQSKFYIGPKLGLNGFNIKEYVDERPVNDTDNYQYNSNYWESKKIGIGLLLEYERNILSDNISVFFSTEPEVIFFSKSGLMGSSDPIVIGCINFNLGFKFNMGENKKFE